MDGQIAPTRGRFQPDDPFPADASLYITIGDETLTAESIKVIPHKAKYDNLESFEAFKATKEQIWAFEARVFADQLALCTALAKKMNETAETELSEHGKWREGIKQLLPKLVEAANDSKGLCDLVGDTIQQPTSK